MLTAGVIKSVNNVKDNKVGASESKLSARRVYQVSINLFRYGGDESTYTVKASAINPPGHYNNYKANDIVIVSFFENDFDQAVILGKVDTPPTSEITSSDVGAIYADTITANNITANNIKVGEQTLQQYITEQVRRLIPSSTLYSTT